MQTAQYESNQLHVKMGLCSLTNAPLDFKRNYDRIYQSIEICRNQDCAIRVGAQLEVSGYQCLDHFCEYDTIQHSWQVVRDLLKSGITNGIVVDVGCPVLHKAALYNCRVVLYNSKVIAIRPKMIMADGSNNYETRWFSAWKEVNKIDEFFLPMIVQQVTDQTSVPIGCFILNFNDTRMAYQICQEAWISRNPVIEAALDGAEIFVNPSASDSQRGKLKRKIQMIQELTQRHGGAYAYMNVKGCGDRCYYDAGCIFTENGQTKFLSQLHTLSQVQVTPVIINLGFIRAFRLANKSFQKESNCVNKIPRVSVDVSVAVCDQEYYVDSPSHQANLKRLMDVYLYPHITLEPSLWLWEYLRKTGACGFCIPLSGGVDSTATAMVVYNMCDMVFKAVIDQKDQSILETLRKITRKPQFMPTNVNDIMKQVLYSVYFASINTIQETRVRAARIASSMGSSHRTVNFDLMLDATKSVLENSTGIRPKFKLQGGTQKTDHMLQAIQARMRMLMAYAISSMEVQMNKKEGTLLVLTSTNLDKALRGNFHKYDTSSGDYCPLGSLSKFRIREYLEWNYNKHGFEFIKDVLSCKSMVELTPLSMGRNMQNREQQCGFTSEQLCEYGKLRMGEQLGPLSMFERLLAQRKFVDAKQLAKKIKKFFIHYAHNRHKVTTLPPSFHYDPESCDDNRYDTRPFLYETDWRHQFTKIDQHLAMFLKLHPSAKSPQKLQRAVSFAKKIKRRGQ